MTDDGAGATETGDLRRQVAAGLLVDDMGDLWPAAERLGDVDFYALTVATAGAVAYRIWPENPRDDEYPVIAERIAGQVPDDRIVTPRVVETAVRALLGEPSGIEQIDTRTALAAYMLIIKTGVSVMSWEGSERAKMVEEIALALEGI